MPNEHLQLPKTDGEWKDYRRASREALAEGEIADLWLEENSHKGMDEFARLAGLQAIRDATEEANFDSWRKREEDTIADGTTLAATEAETFRKLAAKEAERRMSPTLPGGSLSNVFIDLTRLPRPLTREELEARRADPDRGPWEAAFDALDQFGLSPDDDRFISVLADTRQRISRSAGVLTGGFDMFLRATEMAVATANQETLPSATWANSKYKSVADELHTALQTWDNLMRQFAEPSAQDLETTAAACKQKLAAFAQECTPTSQFSNTVAFASLNGLAMVFAIGERIGAQIACRAGAPTVHTLYDRLSEIPNRAPADPNSPLGKKYNAGYQKLARTWGGDLEDRQSEFKSEKQIDPQFLKDCFGKLQKPIANRLADWDRLMNDATNVVNPGGLAQLKTAVANLATQLAFLRDYVATKHGMRDPNAPQSDVFKAAREDYLSSIDTLTAQMQRRLALALQIV